MRALWHVENDEASPAARAIIKAVAESASAVAQTRYEESLQGTKIAETMDKYKQRGVRWLIDPAHWVTPATNV